MQKIKKSSFFSEIKTSLKLALISFLPCFILGGALFLNRVKAGMPEKFSLIVGYKFFNQVNSYRPIVDFYTWFLSFLSDQSQQRSLYFIMGFLFVVFFVAHLFIINPNFRVKNFSFKKWWKEGRIFVSTRIAEYFLISLFLIVFVGRFLFQYNFFFFGLVSCVLLFWLLWHKDGFFGDLKKFEYPNSPWQTKNIKFKSLFFVAISSLLFSFLLFFLQQITEYVLDKPALLASYLVGYRAWFTVFDHALLDMLAFSFGVFLLPILYLISDLKNYKKIPSKAVVPLVLIILFGGLMWNFQVNFIQKFEIDKSALTLANFETDKIVNKQLVVFDDNKTDIRPFKAEVNFRTIDLERKVSNTPGDPRLVNQTIPCTEKNLVEAKKIYDFVSIKSFNSSLFESYLSYSSGKGSLGLVSGCSLFDFDIKTILDDKFLASSLSTDSIGIVNYLKFLGKTASLSVKKLDSSWFPVNANAWGYYGYLYLADWHYYNGNLERVIDWYGIALDFLEKNKLKLDPAKDLDIGIQTKESLKNLKLKFNKGVISGKIVFNNPSLLKIGLLRKKAENVLDKGIRTISGGFLDGYTLMASSSLEEAGSFRFENIVEGDYYLVILVNDGKKVNVQRNKSFGKIEINEKMPTFEIGVIGL